MLFNPNIHKGGKRSKSLVPNSDKDMVKKKKKKKTRTDFTRGNR